MEFNSQRNGLVHQYGRRFFVLEQQYGCSEKRSIEKDLGYSLACYKLE